MADLWINQANLNRFFNRLAQEIAQEARNRAPVDQGQLRDSIRVESNNRIVINPVDENGRSYAASVEFGRAPGGRVPPGGPDSRLAIWAGTPGRAVWELAKAIARKGIRPKPFFFPAVKLVAERYLKNVRVR